ncbi:MAG: SpoIID/LytB domain-containing protein [Niameybacter sp.]
MSRYDRGYRNSRNYRSSRSGRRGRYEESHGGGLAFIIFVFILAVGAYLISGDSGQAFVEEWMGKAQQAISNGIIAKQEETPTLPSNMTPCTKANIAKIVAYTLMEDTPLEDISEESLWYSKYYTRLKEDPKFNFFDEQEAMEVMTYEEATQFFVDILGEGYAVNVDATQDVSKKSMTLKQFLKGFEQALEHAGKKDLLHYEELSILATSLTDSRLGAWQVLTDKGIYGFEGLILDPCVGYTLHAIVKNDEILGIVDTISATSKIQKCYVVAVADGKATLRVDEYELTYKNQIITPNEIGKICTVTIQNGEVLSCEVLKEDLGDRILRMTDDYIEFEIAGRLPYQKLTLYDGTGTNTYTQLGQLFSGIKVSYTMQNDCVQTLKVLEDQTTDEVRVLLSQDGVSGYTQENVQVTCEGGFVALYGDKKQEIASGEVWDASQITWEIGKSKVTLMPKGESQLQVASMTRKEKQPTYKGALEVYKEEEGFTLVNKVDLESYIAGVIPSEMPTSYEKEALKAQAIAARSFTKSQQKSNKFLRYGAQLDDTVASQVYNHTPEDEASYAAAEATKGEVMLYNERIVNGNFFSTSAGYTANYGETWAIGEIFPSNTPSFLVARQQYVGERVVEDLSSEKNAYTFFTTAPSEIDAFDQDAAWFRWQVHMSAEELEQVVNANIYKLTTNYPNMVKVKEGDNWVIGEIDNIGAIKQIQVTKRGEGGNIMEMLVEGEKMTVKVGTEYLIRSLFAPVQKDATKDPIIVTRADGSEIKNMALLPSAFFSMDIHYEDTSTISEIDFYGGGYGHGVGMSQNGAQGMAKRGYTYKEILRHYYNGVTIEEL